MGTISDFYRGDTKEWTVTLTYVATGLPVNLNGCTVFLTLKSKKSAIDDDAEVKIDQTSHVDEPNGVTSFTLAAAVTETLKPGRKYYYDIQVVDSAGKVATAMEGDLTVLLDVTRRVS